MAFSPAVNLKTVAIALLFAFILSFALTLRYCQRYIEFDVTLPSASWLHMFASSGGETTQYRYKGVKVDSPGVPVHVRLPLTASFQLDALLIRLEKPGGEATFERIRIVGNNGDDVTVIPTSAIDTSGAGTLREVQGKLLLAPTGLSDTLDIRINLGGPLPFLSQGAGLYFLRMFLSGGLCAFLLLQLFRKLPGQKFQSGVNTASLEAAVETVPVGRGRYLPGAGLFLLIFGLRLWLIRAFGSDLPFWDQWDAEATNLYLPYANGSLSMGDLFAPHNEHRILLTRLASLGLLLLNGKWDPLLQMVVNAAAYAGVGLLVFSSICPPQARSVWAVAVVFLFSLPFGWQNTLGGFQLQFYLMTGLSILFLRIMTGREPGWKRLVAGGTCAVLLLFTMASGFLACVALLLAIAVSAARKCDRVRLRQFLPASCLCVAVTAAGFILKTDAANNVKLKAESIGQFLAASATYLGWPLSSISLSIAGFSLPLAAVVLAAVLLWLPILLYMRECLGSGEDTPGTEFMMSVAIWVVLQSAATAYARGEMLMAPSRYQDLFALGVLVNFAALLAILQRENSRNPAWLVRLVALLWLAGTSCGLIHTTGLNTVHELPEKRSQQQAGLENVREYLASGNMAALEGKPKFDIPYPERQKLAMLLDKGEIRRLLPASVTGSREMGRLRPVANALLDGSAIIVLAGLSCFAVAMTNALVGRKRD